MILQLNPPIPVKCTKGEGLAHALIDYGIEHHLYWVIFITETGECWTYANPQVRAVKNISYNRTFEKDTKIPNCGNYVEKTEY